MTAAIAPMTAAYVALAVLLLSLNLLSRWAWPVKAVAVVLTTAFFVGAYFGAVSLLGWPSRARMPPHFQLLWTKVVEPDKATGENGSIFMWVEPLDENNIPVGRPRSYELPYSRDLAKKVGGAQQKLQQGEQVAGKAEKVDEDDQLVEDARMGPQNPNAQETSRMDTVPFSDPSQRVQFEDMPPPILPEKGPIQ
jgi:hypothetical protein